jgi:biotin operon repressor
MSRRAAPLICQVLDHLRGEPEEQSWPELRALDRLVLLLFAGHGDPDGSGVWPSQQTIAREAHLSRSTVQEATYALRDLGILHVVRERGSGYRTDEHAIELPDLTVRRSSQTPRLDGELTDTRPGLDRDLTGTGPAGGHNQDQDQDQKAPSPPTSTTDVAREASRAAAVDGGEGTRTSSSGGNGRVDLGPEVDEAIRRVSTYAADNPNAANVLATFARKLETDADWPEDPHDWWFTYGSQFPEDPVTTLLDEARDGHGERLNARLTAYHWTVRENLWREDEID